MSWSPQNLPLRATISILVIFLLPLANSAPLTESSTEIEYYPVADATGCYYNFQHYDEGDRIITNEPCLNCTCHNRMLMCYLRVCPFTKAIGQDCTVEKRADQCCPVITCPEVPVSLMPSSTPGSTEVGHPDTYGCSIDSLFYSDGARVPSHPNNPCELCYCIRNKTACVMQECTLKIEGCKPVYQEGVCCPVRYDCDHSNDNLLEGPTSTTTTTTTTTTSTTPGLIFTTTLAPGKSTDCIYNNDLYADGALINHVKPCENCYCMKGDIVCAVQECAPTPLEKINCTALPVREGQCCPDAYECENMTDEDLTTLSYNEITTLPSIVPEDTKAPSEEPLAITPEATGQTIPSLVDRDQFTESPASGVKSEDPKQTTTISDVLIPITTVTPDAMTQKSEEQITTVLPDNNETKSPIIDLIPESQTEERAPEVTTQTVINQEPLSEKTSTTYNSELSSTEPSHTPVEELSTTEHTAPKQTTTQEEIRETTEKDYQVTDVPQVETTSNEFTQITTEKEMEYVTMLPETENKHIASAEHVTEPKPLETTFGNIKPSETPEETHDKEDLGGVHDDDEDDQEHEQPVDETQEKETEPSMSTEHVPQLETIESGLSFPEKSDKSPESITEYKKEPEEVTESSPQTTQSLNAEDDNQKPSLSLTDKDLTGSTVVSVEEENVEPTEKLEKEKEPAILQTTVALEDVTTPLEPTHEQITEEPAEPSHEPEGEHDDHEEEDIITEAQHPEVVSSESAATTLASETAATTVASETAATTVASETAAITVASESGIEITESNKISEDSLVDKTTTSTKEESIVTTEYSIASSSESEQKQDTATYTEKEPEQTTLLHEEVTEGIKEPSSTESLSTREPNLEEQTTDKQHQEVPFDTKSETTTLGNIFENEVTTSQIQEVTETESSIPQRPYGIPGEGSCLVDGQTYQNNSEVPTINHCQTSCKCISSILQCQAVDCTPPPRDSQNCYPVYAGPESCCPTFNCSAASADKNMEIDNGVVDSECISTECKLVGSQPDQVEGSTETSPITDKPGIQSEDKQATESPEEQSGVVTTIISDRMPEEDTSTTEAVKPETSNIKLTPEKEETTTVSNKEQQTEKTGEHDLQQITESAPVDITTSIQEQTTNKVAIEEHVTTEKVIGEFTEASATVQPDVNLPTSEKITTEKETQTSRIPGEDIHHDNEDLFEPESGDTETTQDTTETKVSQETTTLRENLADVSTNKPIEESIATQPQQNVPESVTDRIAESQTTISSDEKVTTLKPLVESEAETTDAHEFTSENKLSEENPTTSYEIVHPETTVASQEVTTEKSQKDIVQPESRPEEIITDNAITDKITTEKVPEIEAPEILTQSPEVTLVEQRPESMDHKQSTEEITTVKPKDETIKSLSSSEQPETTTKPATVSSEQPTSLPEQTVSSEMPTSRPQQAVAVTQEPEHQPESAGVTESSEAKKPIPEITTVVSEQQTEVPDKVTSATEPAVIVSEFITTKEPHVETDKPIGVTQSTDAAELPVAETEVPAIVTEQSIVLTEPSVESTKQPAFEIEKPSTENEIPIAATGKPSDVTEQKPIATDAPSIETEHSEITTISSIPVTEQTFSTEQSVVKGEHPEIINEPLDISTEQSAWSEAETTEQDGKATEQPPVVTEQPQIILEVATTVDPETTSASAEQSEAVTRAEELTTMSESLSDPLSHKTELPIELTTAESPEKSSSELNEPSAVNPTTIAPEETTMKASSKTPFNEADLTTTISSVAELSTEKEALEPTKEVNTISPELEKETEPENEVTSIPSVSTSETTESEIEVTTPIEHEKESIPEKTQAGDENLKATETTEPWADVTTDASADSIGEGIKGQETEKPIKSETTTSSENYERTTVGAETENPIKPEEPVNQTELATSNQEPGKEYTTLAPDTTEKLTEVAVTDAPKESEVTTSKQEAAFTSPSLTTKDTNEHPAPSTESTGGLFTSPPEIISTTGNKYVVGELSTSATSSTTAAAAVETTTVAAVETTIGAINEIHDHDEHQPEMPDYQAPGEDYEEEDHNTFGPGTCRYGGKVYVSAQQIPRDDPCDFCFCFRSDIICLQQSCPPPIPRCHEEPIRGFCCPRYECPVNMATSLNVTTTTTTTTTTLPPHFLSHAYKGRATKTGCLIRGQAYKVGDHIPSASGPCLNCTCGGNGQMKCDPKACSPEPMLRQMMEAAISRRRR